MTLDRNMRHPIIDVIAKELDHDRPGFDTELDRHHAQNIVDAIGRWVNSHLDDALPWEHFADESTLTRPLFEHGDEGT